MSKNTPKVLCPYCGAEMEECEMADLLGFLSPAIYDLVVDRCTATYMYNCPECWACTPMAKTMKEAYTIALRRPLQKPLTLDEITKTIYCLPCWLEEEDDRLSPDVLDRDSVGFFFKMQAHMMRQGIDECVPHYPEDEYNITWRCWATVPTREEREAAKWEEPKSEQPQV